MWSLATIAWDTVILDVQLTFMVAADAIVFFVVKFVGFVLK